METVIIFSLFNRAFSDLCTKLAVVPVVIIDDFKEFR